jgi:hypothetical protein
MSSNRAFSTLVDYYFPVFLKFCLATTKSGGTHSRDCRPVINQRYATKHHVYKFGNTKCISKSCLLQFYLLFKCTYQQNRLRGCCPNIHCVSQCCDFKRCVSACRREQSYTGCPKCKRPAEPQTQLSLVCFSLQHFLLLRYIRTKELKESRVCRSTVAAYFWYTMYFITYQW